MKKFIPLILLFPFMMVSCTFEKGEVVAPVQDCVNDSTIDVVNVAVEDNFFNPASITIVAGDTVKWTMNGAIPHTSTCDGTSGSTMPSGGTSWDSGVMTTAGDFYQQAITVPGNYTYVCIVHGSSMTGTIVVKPRCQ
jgi:plastocyanin